MRNLLILLQIFWVGHVLGDSVAYSDPQIEIMSPQMGMMPPSTLPGQLPGAMGQGGAGGPGQPQTSQCGMVDQCCGMAHEGCCAGGQQCYTYYENVCENVNQPRCRMKGREFCDEAVMPDCRIEKTRGNMPINQEVCTPKSRQECFEWTRTVCDMRPGSVYKEVQWENQKLDPVDSENKTKCETIKRCNYTSVEKVVQKTMPVQNCTDVKETNQVCGRVPITKYKVVEQVVQVMQYVPECQVVNQPSCSSSPCQSNGCSDGGSVCSATDFNPQTVCAQGQGAQGQMTGSSSDCQQVQTPVCYGNTGSCSYGQQCCSNSARQVCRQVPRRVPVRRNVTVPDVTWEEQCRDVETVRPNCVTNYETQNLTTTEQVCNDVMVEECYNYTIPTYKVVMEEKSENVSFVINKCQFRNVTDRYCHTFPQAEFTCVTRIVNRQYLLNKVVCKERKPVKFCRIIPESECDNVPNQQCRMVPKQVCQPGCSSSNTCNKCDSFRNQGGFSSCSTGQCPNYFPEDPFIGGNYGQGYNPGGEGFNPGYTGGQGFNPGNNGGQGFNPGNNGGQGFNPGNNGGQGFNPGNNGGPGFNPGNNGGQGFNPGHNGGHGFHPGHTGGQGFNPGDIVGGSGFNPGVNGGEGYNTGNDNLVVVGDDSTVQDGSGSNGWDNPGDDWYNPGAGGYNPGTGGYNPGGLGEAGYNPGNMGGNGFNPGNMGGSDYNPGNMGGGGYNPGNMGGGGYNPGNMGGSGYNPGNMGGSGYNPGNMGGGGYNPGNMGGAGYNPGNMGGSGFNPGTPGQNFYPLEPMGGGQGYNPGQTGGQEYNPGMGGGSQGFNPGLRSSTVEEEESLQAEKEELQSESVVL